MCHLSPVTSHLTTTLCSFSCYEGPRKSCDAAAGGLVNNKNPMKTFYKLTKSLNPSPIKSYTVDTKRTLRLID